MTEKNIQKFFSLTEVVNFAESISKHKEMKALKPFIMLITTMLFMSCCTEKPVFITTDGTQFL